MEIEEEVKHQSSVKERTLEPPTEPVHPDIDGYSVDELEDCLESDTEFNAKTEAVKPKVLPKEVLKDREVIMNDLPNRNSVRENEKRSKLKEKFTDNISKKEWEKFKKWIEVEKKLAN